MFTKFKNEMELKEINFKDERLSNIVNNFLEYEIKDFMYSSKMSILECESPMEQLFVLCFEKFKNSHYHIINFFKNEIDIFETENQIEIGKYRVDFLITVTDLKEKIKKQFVIEIDGHDFHEKTKEQVKRDKEKDRFLISEGYIVVRFTGSEIYNDCSKKVRELLELIVKVCGKNER